MKKIVAFLTALLLVLSLSACSAPKAPEIEHDTVDDQPAQTSATEPTAEPEKQFSHGAWEDRTFTSDYAELTLTLPDESWVISTDEELAQIMDLGMEETDSNLLEKAMMKLTNITDMMAQNPETGANIILMYENLGLNPAAKDLTVEGYAQIVADGLKANESITYTVDEPTTVTLCGNEYLALDAHVDGYDLHQTYLMRYEGDMMVDLILTGVGENGIDELKAMFAD